MTTCLLCPSPAVADLLCVPCGAKLWACQKWQHAPKEAARLYKDLLMAEGNTDCGSVEREHAILEMTPGPRRLFMVLHDAALAAHEARNKEFDRRREHEYENGV
jgi:hypothetical protein